MTNPFEKRATEYLRDGEAFLSVVTPAPLFTFFESKAKDGSLYDRLAVIIGTPGSGKTTLATLFQFKTLETLRRNPGMDGYKELVNALTKCGAMSNERQLIVGCRLPLEAEYREYWELPYSDELKYGLMETLLQARAVLSWLQNLTANEHYQLENISILAREGAVASLDQIGGERARDVYEKARSIERAVYQIGAALVPPKIESISSTATAAYHPFDVIESFQIQGEHGELPLTLKPLVMLDDAHTLHPRQLSELQTRLARRELKIARWILMRLDAQTPESALSDTSRHKDAISRINPNREIAQIRLQKSTTDRAGQRKQFRKMAKDMADKYLRLMDVFNRQGITNLANILSTKPERLSESKFKELTKKVIRVQRECNVSEKRRTVFEEEIEAYFAGSKIAADNGRDVRMSMLSILMHRYVKRIPQASLFDVGDDQEPSKPIAANLDVANGARIHLLYEYERPYYFGLDVLCDASSENAEQFLHLAGRLVSIAETRIVRGFGDVTLSAFVQHRELRKRTREILTAWSFPEHKLVRHLTDEIARQCVNKAKEPNASLGGGPNTFGIPQEEFNQIANTHPRLAQVLKYGVAYNAFSLVSWYKTKGVYWCLLELSGATNIHHGLCLSRGSFLERDVAHLSHILEGFNQ